MNKHRPILLLLFFLTILNANDFVKLNDKKVSYHDFSIYEFEDKSNSLNIQDIEKIDTFKKVSNKISNGYITGSTFWYKILVKNETLQTKNTNLVISESYLNNVEIYEKSDLETKQIYVGKLPSLPKVNLTLEENELKTIYIKIESIYPLFISFDLYDDLSFEKHMYKHNIFYIFIFGAIIALILYNFVIYLYGNDIAYLYYVLYVSSFLIWQIIMNAIPPTNEFLNKENFYTLSSSIPLMLGFMTLFSRSILDTKSNLPKIDFILKSIAIVFMIFTFIALIDFKVVIPAINALASITIPFLLFIGFKSLENRNKIARFYLMAQLPYLSLSTLFSLSAYGYLEYSNISRHGIIIGSLFEIILFSLALAYRIKLLEEEKLYILQSSKDDLEIKIKERTKELEESKEKLKHLANTDSMTNLYNRRFLYEISKKLIYLSKREKQPLSLIIFDIDNFKIINDTYGHKVGDKVIIEFASQLKKHRQSDIISRVGGEEFVILLPNTTKEQAFIVANKIREERENNPFITNQINLFFTISGGIDSLKESDVSIEDVISRADIALYKAKNKGRNQIQVYM